MTVKIERMSGVEAFQSFKPEGTWSNDESVIMNRALLGASSVWSASIDGEGACLIGLVAPTILSNRAYIWLYHTGIAEQHKFVLVRHSQLLVEDILKDYHKLFGHCVIDDPIRTERSIRWLKWLGAEFSEPEGKLLPFCIRKK